MTEATDADHYDLDRLADLAEDLLPDADATAARAHLDSCPSCRAEYAAVQGVGGLLLAAAHPPMPLDVTTRIEAALTQEAAAHAGAPAGAGAPGRTAAAAPPVVPAHDDVSSLAGARARRTHRIRRAATALVGVAAVLGGVFVFGSSVDWLGGADDESTAGGFDSSARDEAASGGNDTAAPEAAEGEDTEEGTGDDGAEAPPEAFAAGGYTAAGLTDEVRSLLADATPPRLSGTEAPSDQDGTQTDGVPDSTVAAGCVAAVAAETGIDRAPLAVDVSSYEDRAAVVVVVAPARGDTGVAQIWVVGDGCLTNLGTTGTTKLEVLGRATLAIPAPRD